MAEEESYYVNIREPADLRKSLLETSRQIVRALQKYEHFRIGKNKKKDEREKLKGTLRDINTLSSQLTKELPAKKIKGMPAVKAPEAKVVAIKKGKKSEIASLESDLADIEKKLSRLK
ncbi:hypothetical protein KY308_02660 [Candidatus Woesearchaeota archaeon]|nr:hypothetical protein [Candidatus Woesearchaeota archaeon]